MSEWRLARAFGYLSGMDWQPLFPLDSVSSPGMKAKNGILVVRTEAGSLHAVDAACPHQGYPLAQGSLNGCVLTCTWHNFKFDVQSGACTMGDEGVCVHRVRVHAGMVEVSRNVAVDLPRLWAGLGEAVRRHQTARAVREAARLMSAGVPEIELLAWAAAQDGEYGEYGLGHVAALAAEMATWPTPEGVDAREFALNRVGQVLDLLGVTIVGLPKRTRPRPESFVGDGVAILRERVEAEAAAEAEAMVRGFVAARLERSEWESLLYPLVAEHFLDFGHGLIYVAKVLDLLDAAGPTHADAILGGLVYGLANGTREELLPPWAAFRSRWTAFVNGGGLAKAHTARTRGTFGGAPADSAVVAAVAFGTPGEAFAATAGAMQAGAWEPVVDAIVLAASQRLLRFELSHDQDPTVEEGWLDVTHRLTAASALRTAVRRWNDPAAARLVLMVAHFVNLGRGLDGAPAPGVAGDLEAALAEGRAEDAAASVRGPQDAAVLRAQVFSERSARPIFFAHDAKTLTVGLHEAASTGDLSPLRAAARYLASPVRERSVAKMAHEALRLVRDGKPPRGLTG